MSTVKTNKVWNGMNVVEKPTQQLVSSEYIRREVQIFGTLLASSGADGSWKLNDEPAFRSLFNSAPENTG